MSDKLEKCVCGGDAYIKTSTYGYFKYCNKYGCVCRTPVMMSPDEATQAWQTMQCALKSVWSSEAPTEIGHYLAFSDTGIIINVKVIKYEGGLGALTTSSVYDLYKFHTKAKNRLWYRINYPDPPKD